MTNVAMLEPLGYVTSTPDPADKRVRIISRTDLGDQAVRTSNELMAAIEEEWKSLIGARRWATTRAVMLELAVGWDAGD